MATSAYLVSRAAVVSEVAGLTLAIAAVRVFAISRAVFRYFERLVSHRVTFRILEHLRVWFYSAIEPLAPARLGAYQTGDLLTRIIGDVETLENFYVRVVVPPIAAALAVAFACSIVGVFNPSLALALLFFLLLTGVVLPVTFRWLGKSTAANAIVIRAKLNAMLVDQVQGAPDLLVFDNARTHEARLLCLSNDLNRTQERISVLRGAGNALTVLFTGMAALAVLWLAIPLVTDFEIDAVYLALLPLVAIAGFDAVASLPSALQQLEANQLAGKRLFELIDAPAEVSEPSQPARVPLEFSIEASGLTFRYDRDGPPVLDNLSFSLPTGSRTVIVGPSGSGKTTIVNLLLRFWDYETGVITLGGSDLRLYQSYDVRSVISVVPQNVHLFNATIRDNLLLADPDATEEQILEACRVSLLHDFIDDLPRGYDTVVGEDGVLLSGGERQRLAIARAVLKNAPIMILDEPTANLDATTERALLRSLEPFMAGRTVLIISHRHVALELADQVIDLQPGAIRHPGHPIGVRGQD